METVTSTPTAGSLNVSGTTQVNGTISWSKPIVPSGSTISSCVLTGKATASMSKGSATITVNGENVTSDSTFTVNLGTSNTTTSVTTTAAGGNKNAAGTVSFSDLVYTVTYEIPETPEVTYTVTFKDWDGVILKTESVAEGGSATAPTDPTREGYTFTGWDKSFTNVTSDLIVIAQYEENSSGGDEPPSGGIEDAENLFPSFYTEWTSDHPGYARSVPIDDFSSSIMIDDREYGVFSSNIPEIQGKVVRLGAEIFSGSAQMVLYYADGTSESIYINEYNKESVFEVQDKPCYLYILSPMGYDITDIENAFLYIISDLNEVNVYSVQFNDNENNAIKTEGVLEGEDATAPEAPIIDGYTFKGWDKDYTNVTSDLIVTAQYISDTAVAYTVTFYDWDGVTILGTVTVAEGSSATAPTDPTREGYTFTGWDKDFTNVTSDLIVTAQYSIKQYTVTFYDWDGVAVLKTQQVNHGSSATAPSVPVRDGYNFTGWDKDFSNVTSDLSLIAQYSIKQYTVTFYDWDGVAVLKTQQVNHGSSATAPSVPVRDGYNFTGWDKDFTNVTSDLSLIAKYSIKQYTVIFKDWDGSTIVTKTVNHGSSATAPSNPVREGYNFTGWDKDFSNVTEDLVVTAQYTLKPSYTVTFVDWDGTILKTQTVMEGSNAIAPNNPYREGYIFVGWNASLDNVLSNLTIEAQYIVKSKIKVTFLNWNGSILKEEQVYEGESVMPPEAPTRIGYDFIGWDRSSNIIVEDTIINAVFVIKTFFVQFRDYNGVVLDEQRIDYNNSAVLPNEPIREGYTFVGWDKSLNNITSDTIIMAQYSKKAEALHTVVFKDWDGSILSTQEIEHGGSANGIPNPIRDNHVFSGWDNKFINITSDMTITAQYLYLGDFSDALSGVNFNNMSINKLSINGKDVNALYVGDMVILILKSQFFK